MGRAKEKNSLIGVGSNENMRNNEHKIDNINLVIILDREREEQKERKKIA